MVAGFPGFIISMMNLLQAVVVFNALSQHGTDLDLAWYGAAHWIYLLLMTPLFGLMRALQPVAGIKYGARQFDRVKQSYMLFSQIGLYIIFPF